jgi:hypothetical protein
MKKKRQNKKDRRKIKRKKTNKRNEGKESRSWFVSPIRV